MHHHHHHPPHVRPVCKEPPLRQQIHVLDAHARYHREMLCKAYDRLAEHLDNLDPTTLEHITEILTEISESESRVNAALQSMQEQIHAYAEIIAAQGTEYELVPLYDSVYKNLMFNMEVDTDGDEAGN